MRLTCQTLLLLLCLSTTRAIASSDTLSLSITVLNEQHQPLESAVVALIRSGENKLIKTGLTDRLGNATLNQLGPGKYYCSISFSGYQTDTSEIVAIGPGSSNTLSRVLKPKTEKLQEVVVRASKPFVQFDKGKVVVNVDASPTNTGTTVMEVLEKSPGVTIDQNGNISLKAKSGVLVLIDGKQTYLSGQDLANLLSTMSSSQVEQIELITNPGSQYDASGNAGIINIKTKKNRQRGFNGSLNIGYSQGRYPKTNNSASLNYRDQKINAYLNYSYIYNRYYSDLYALRTYFDDAGHTTATLDQPTLFTGHFQNHTLKTGIDFFATSKTTLGIGLTGILSARSGNSNANASWIGASGETDSSLTTTSATDFKLSSGGINGSLRHNFSATEELAVDVDWLNYNIQSNQSFVNTYDTPGGTNDASKGTVPSALHILTGKADYSKQLRNGPKLGAGLKSSYVQTDNLASYDYNDGGGWQPDYGKSNHFLYNEKIQAAYGNLSQELSRFSYELGLRYEYTAYDANQLGNPVRKDSSFSRNYDGFFPSGNISWQADSSNRFTFTVGRRIDRPAFQQLNPFVFIVNKYTYQTGNPYFKPQYSWNLELSHQFKNYLTTTLSYSIIKDYFSQLFLTDTNGILYYSQGNVGKAYIAGLSVSTQLNLFPWWNLSAQAVLNYKKLEGYVWGDFNSSIWQFNFNASNQFKLGDKYSAELSGFFVGPARNDLQEKLLPTGQLNIGVARTVMKKKGTVKLTVRDILHTQTMSGNTSFQHANEYFIIYRDSRVATIAFTYRFGKPLKAIKRSNGAEEEIQRVNG